MTVLSKFFVSRGVKFPAHGRVGKFRCGPTRSSIHEMPHQKKFRIASLNVDSLRGRSKQYPEEVWASIVFRKSDRVVLPHV